MVKISDLDRAAANIQKLSGFARMDQNRYQRNLNIYLNNAQNNAVSIYSSRSQMVYGYTGQARTSTGDEWASVNVVRSAVDAIVSKMSQLRVRPTPEPVDGTYKSIKASRIAQKYFDKSYDLNHIYTEGPLVLRSALIFRKAGMWIDGESGAIRRVEPWEICYDPAELKYGGPNGLTHCGINLAEVPWRVVKNWYKKNHQADLDKFEKQHPVGDDMKAANFWVYYDLQDGHAWYSYDGNPLFDAILDYDIPPIEMLWWCPPENGYASTSFVDEAATIQQEINELQIRMSDALRHATTQLIMYPRGGDIRTDMITNQYGQWIPYTPGPDGGGPVFNTPPIISEQFERWMQRYIDLIYNVGGISQLSAMGKKPTGLDSRPSMETFENIESDRHNLTILNYNAMNVGLAKKLIKVMPKNDPVLPDEQRSSLTWGELSKESDSFRMSFFAGSFLSRDPSTRQAQIDSLVNSGYIPQEQAMRYMEMPDLDSMYSAITASYDYNEFVIQRAAEENIIDFLEVTDLNGLYKQSLCWMMKLSSDKGNAKQIGNISQLMKLCDQKLSALQVQTQQAQAQNPMPAQPGQAGNNLAGQPQGVANAGKPNALAGKPI